MSAVAFDVVPPLPPSSGLVEQMRHRTRMLHREAERTGIIASLLRGEATLDAYALYLRTLLPAYQAMERVLAAKRNPLLTGLACPELYRCAAIEADLGDLAGPGWRDSVPLLESGRAYAHRVETAGRDDGGNLLAHCYTRYLGDLLGGQVIGQRVMKLPGANGWSPRFAAFPDIADPRGFANTYRAALDQVGHQTVAHAPVVAEAEAAFRMNITMSREVLATAG